MFGHILSSISLYVWFFQGFVLKTTLLLKLDQLQELYIIYVAVYTLLIYLLSTLVISRIYQVIHVYIYIYIHIYQGLFWSLGAWVHFLGQISKKGVFCLLATPKQKSFSPISNNYFFKTQGTRLSVIIAPNEVLENRSCMCMCVYIYVCMCVYIYIFIHSHKWS